MPTLGFQKILVLKMFGPGHHTFIIPGARICSEYGQTMVLPAKNHKCLTIRKFQSKVA